MKVFQFNLQDSLGNKKTLICRLRDGNIRYVLYGGWGSSGISFSVSDIYLKYHDHLPVENLPSETKDEFIQRVWDMLENSTDKPVKNVNVNVKFA
tara:strand:- start:463 stop:747 length:285 start_codon:yes stop_codon:yes gene_type:complete